MEAKKLTNEGINFIKAVSNYFTRTYNNDRYLLEGNRGKLPKSDSDANKVWVANITNIYTNKPVTNNNQLIDYLIQLYSGYSAQFGVDPNIMAAQGFQESEFIAWAYAGAGSASGVAQIVMATMYDLIYNPSKRWLTDDEKNKIINGLSNPETPSSWLNTEKSEYENEDDIARQYANHSILHQNIIDNPDISIKLQCRLMDYIAKRNNNLASTALFFYNRGSQLRANNYIQAINRTASVRGNDYCNEGLIYVENIFGYLGDKNHQYVKNKGSFKSYVKGYWFGYDIKFNFDPFVANSSSDYAPERSTTNPSVLVSSLKLGFDNATKKFLATRPGFRIVLSSVYRTPEYQYSLYQRGRNARGEIIGETITPVDGFIKKSKHNFYNTKAFDFNIYDASNTFLDGKNNQLYRPLYEEFYNYVREIEPTVIWGGTFRNQPNDVYHIELP